jgi:predicted nuclease of restriction endonuclease-like (RecB) superfamily
MTALQLPGYEEWLHMVKDRIRAAQTRAAAAANRELVLLYWHIGREILERQRLRGWGAKVVDRLAGDLKLEFPGMKGLSRSNLLYMRAFAQAWPDPEFVQAVLGQLSWYHQISLLEKLKSQEERAWYAQAAISN